MKKIITLILGLSLMTVLLIAQTSEQNNPTPPAHRPMHSQQNPGLGNPMHHGNMQPGPNPQMGWWSRLDLNRSQHATVSRIVERFRNEQQRSREEMRNLRTQLRQAMANENYRRARNLNRRMNTLRGNMSEARINMHEQIMNVLNPEQKAQARRMLEEMHNRRQNRQRDCEGSDDCGMRSGDMGRGMNHGSGDDCPMNQGGNRRQGMNHGQRDDCTGCGDHQGNRPRTEQN